MMPKKKSIFYDLRLRLLQDGAHNRELLNLAAEMGYSCIAVDHEFSLVKKSQIPHSRDLSMAINGYPERVQKGLKVLKRLTVTVEEPSLLHVLTSPTIAEYDVIAVQPNSERTFQQACANMPIDIIAMDMSHQLPYSLRRQQIGQAIERGVVFEIFYTPTLLDPTARRYTFSNALDLIHICRGKNVIVSSGAQRPMELRAPYDIANLCHLFGLKGGGQCKALLTTNCELTILHAEMRKSSAKGIVTSCHIGELEEFDQWQIADPFDMTTGARLQHENSDGSSSSSDDDVVVRKRKLQASSPKVKKRKKRHIT